MIVKLRKKKTKKGESLYLDIYHNGQREYEFLKILLTKDKASNKEKMRIAENIRAKKELEILSGAHGLTPKFKKKANMEDASFNTGKKRPAVLNISLYQKPPKNY